MNVYENLNLGEILKKNTYPGRGIVIGKTPDGNKAVVAYFIMGRSENSRNRIFVRRADALYTEPIDHPLVADPSLILYAAVREAGNRLIVANGDQSDTVSDALLAGGNFASALETRTYEPDAPHYTPRITALLDYEDNRFSYQMSILKREESSGECLRPIWKYPSTPGVGHLIHTYRTDGNPLPSFRGDPVAFALPERLDDLTDSVWEALDSGNRISLYIRYTNLRDRTVTERIVNRNRMDKKEIL